MLHTSYHSYSDPTFTHHADVVVVGAGGAGLPAAIAALDGGASVICVDAHYDVGGHAIVSGGFVALGGGTRWQTRYEIADSAEQVYNDYREADMAQREMRTLRYADREHLKLWADGNCETFEFLVDNGVMFPDESPRTLLAHYPGDTPRLLVARPSSEDMAETINRHGGSGVVRPLEACRTSKRRHVSAMP